MIIGKIINIIDQYAVVIDKGEIDGVSVGMKFKIFEYGDMIKDVSTNQDIEKIELTKDVIRVITTQEKISICETAETVTTAPWNPYRASPIAGLIVESKKTLNIDNSDVSNIKYKSDNPISIGDYVREILTK